MIQSMTGYAKYEIKNNSGNITWEIRSLNQRYLETYFRFPEQFRNLETFIREKIRSSLIRGRIECNLYFESNIDKNSEELFLNKNFTRQLVNAANWIRIQNNGSECKINLIDILRWPGVLMVKEKDINEITKDVLSAFDNTLKKFIITRKIEGKAIKELIKKRLKIIKVEIKKIRSHMPEILQWQRKRLVSKLGDTANQLEKNRLEQEIVLVAQRMDVSEELDRLEIHVKKIFDILKKKEAIGRYLDFMMQELNRESNTLSSKSISIDITNSAIKLKVLIEQMREQIQNIE